jgi:hypothetical protein
MKQESYGLYVFPNPMTSSSTIEFKIDEAAFVRIELQDLQGRKIKTLADANYGSGDHRVFLNKENLLPGTYFLRLREWNDGEKTIPQTRTQIVTIQ